jgi:hypothetical protein
MDRREFIKDIAVFGVVAGVARIPNLFPLPWQPKKKARYLIADWEPRVRKSL